MPDLFRAGEFAASPHAQQICQGHDHRENADRSGYISIGDGQVQHRCPGGRVVDCDPNDREEERHKKSQKSACATGQQAADQAQLSDRNLEDGDILRSWRV